MGLVEIFADGALTFYLIEGPTLLGYIFLRLGWPNVRALDRQYKAGWSIIIGLVFSAIVVIAALAFSLNPFFPFGFRESLMLNLSVTFIAATLLLTVKRKYLARNRMRVSVPSTLLGAKVTAEKVVEQLERDPGFIRSAGFGEGKLDALKRRLDRDETPPAIVQPNKIFQKPQQVQAAPRRARFSAQQPKEMVKEKITEIAKQAEEKKPLQEEPRKSSEPAWLQTQKKQMPRPMTDKAAQKEQQAKKLDKVEELRRILDERL